MVSPETASLSHPAALLERVYVEETGRPDGPPLLLLHGWASSAELMRSAAAGLEEHFHILNVDLPGHGRTPPPPQVWGVPEFATLVDALLESRGIAEIPVIGHSNGGRIALYMASEERFARRFSQLVLVAPSGVEPQRPLSYYLKTAWITSLKAPFTLLPPPLRGRGLAWLRTTIYWKIVASTDYQQATGVMRETFVKTVRFHMEEELRRIAVPVLIIWGEEDDAVSRYQMEQLEQLIPDAGLVVLPGAGHYAYIDDPVGYHTAVRNFLLDNRAERNAA